MDIQKELPINELKTDTKKLVCVTGASGYLACHVIKLLLEKGYCVRGTVRDSKNQPKIAHLLNLSENMPGKLELFSADLMIEGSFDDAFKDCELICHMASPVLIKSKDPEKDIVNPALNGTINIMKSILKWRTVKRVVITSAVATVFDNHIRSNHVYDENDWNEESNWKTEPYPYAKTVAERMAWKIYNEQLKENYKFELITILPGVALGPVFCKEHLGTSPQIVQQLMDGSLPMAPDLEMAVVDVRDAANAHVIALENEKAHGRFIVIAESRNFLEIANILRKKYGKYKLPSRQAPHWLCYLIALFHPQASWDFLRNHLGVKVEMSNEKARRELGLNFRSIEDSIFDTAQSLIDMKLVK